MLTLEAYIAKRKKEDGINEFSLDDRMINMKICVDYVFEYFNQYLDITKMDEKTILNVEKLDKYRNTISQFDSEIQDWLVGICDDHNKQLNRSIVSLLKKDELFYLYCSDSDFRSSSYDCYAKLIKKNPFLKDQTEMLYLFVKDYHQVQSQPCEGVRRLSFSDEIDLWIEHTWKKYKVNITSFCDDWVNRFYDDEGKWPVSHRKKSTSQWRKYEYDYKQKSNLFNLNSLYTRISGKPFMKGKKQFLEIIMMYYWLNSIEGDDENYWQEYMNKHTLNPQTSQN
jgi:hypothetical protein